ncbi:MAG TPA: DUF5302 domain-containing protein [Candidatus Angelobacter sp.]|nr:DUF5302 domain-containing protein [Candidatus Angelobacter sp.]
MAEQQNPEANEDVKAKFREALERKSKASHGPSARGPEGSSPAHGEHAAESSKREFRRKSGG